MSEIEERFLKLPDSEDYTRVRQFKIDAKGAVVSRGDSFRRKRPSSGVKLHVQDDAPTNKGSNTLLANPVPFPLIDAEQMVDGSGDVATVTTGMTDSRSTSVSSSGSTSAKILRDQQGVRFDEEGLMIEEPTTSHPSYRV